jgi:hypothetical protein
MGLHKHTFEKNSNLQKTLAKNESLN